MPENNPRECCERAEGLCSFHAEIGFAAAPKNKSGLSGEIEEQIEDKPAGGENFHVSRNEKIDALTALQVELQTTLLLCHQKDELLKQREEERIRYRDAGRKMIAALRGEISKDEGISAWDELPE